MTKSYTGPPIPQFTGSEDSPEMSTHAQHAMPEPEPGSVWAAPPSSSGTGAFTVSASGAFSRVVPLVPWSSPSRSLSVVSWNADGSPAGLEPDPTVDADAALKAWAKAEVAAMPNSTWEPGPAPEDFTSGACLRSWPAEYGLHWQCSLPAGHSEGIQCEAQAVKGAVLASRGQEVRPTEALQPTPAKPARRSPSPRPRKTGAA